MGQVQNKRRTERGEKGKRREKSRKEKGLKTIPTQPNPICQRIILSLTNKDFIITNDSWKVHLSFLVFSIIVIFDKVDVQ